jgi:hypothetical protein
MFFGAMIAMVAAVAHSVDLHILIQEQQCSDGERACIALALFDSVAMLHGAGVGFFCLTNSSDFVRSAEGKAPTAWAP